RLTSKVTQFGNNDTATSDSLNRVTEISYDDTNGVITTIEKLLGSEISRTYDVRIVDNTANFERVQTIRCATPGAAINASDNLTNVVWRSTVDNSPIRAWDPLAELNPDGTMSIYSYSAPGNKIVT